MITAETLASPAYDQFESDTLKLHGLIRAGKVNSPEADDVRDALADTWLDLTPDQRRFGNAFSGDLYMLNPAVGETFEPATDEERLPQRLGPAIQSARHQQNWAQSLALLRRGPRFLTPEQVAHLRASDYANLRRFAAAAEFIRFARERNPDDPLYRLVELQWLNTLPARRAEVRELSWRYVDNPAEDVRVVLAASAALIAITSKADQDDATAERSIRRLADILGRVVDGLSNSPLAWPVPGGGPDVLTMARLQLGVCLESFDPEAARAPFQAILDTIGVDLDGRVRDTIGGIQLT